MIRKTIYKKILNVNLIKNNSNINKFQIKLLLFYTTNSITIT